MRNDHLLLLGLNALGRAHEGNYFVDGHCGAGMVAARLFRDNNHLDERACSRIEEMIEINWGSTPLCASFPDDVPRPERINEIGVALVEGAETLRQVGHNAIFAMLAIKAFRMMPEAATSARIDGVCAMIRSFTPWHDVDPDPAVDPPAFEDTAAASAYVLDETCGAIDRFVGFGQGYAGHMLTFGHSLVELAAMGDVALAESCRCAFRKYVTLTRLGPETAAKLRPDHAPSDLRPLDAAYWEARGDTAVGIGHAFKYPYSCYELLRYADNPALAAIWDKKAYHVF